MSPDMNEKIPNLPNNSLTKKENEPEKVEEKLVKKVTTGKRIIKKKGFGDIFFGETTRSVGSYILFEVLIPAAKSTISDMISNGIEMLLYGEPRNRRRDSRDRGKPFVSYTAYYDKGERERDRERIHGRSRFHLDEIVINSRSEANDVVEGMFAILDEYNAVTVADFLELVDIEGEYTDQNYGWTNLRDAEVRRVRDGYVVDLPQPKALPR